MTDILTRRAEMPILRRERRFRESQHHRNNDCRRRAEQQGPDGAMNLASTQQKMQQDLPRDSRSKEEN
jgi:hypothetical protein